MRFFWMAALIWKIGRGVDSRIRAIKRIPQGILASMAALIWKIGRHKRIPQGILASPRTDMLRLRVVANSDEPEDQARKLRVRDAALPVALRDPNALGDILQAAKAIDPTARVRRGVYHFGGYASDTVLVTLGAGAGHNWWGILFPSAMGMGAEPVQFESWIAKLLRSWGWI